MESQKTTDQVADILYEQAISFILIPRTFFLVLVKPKFTTDYVTAQNKEKVKERYEKYSSPILFWITVGIVPYYFLLQYYFSSVIENKELQKVYFDINPLFIMSGISLFLLCYPLSCALILHLFKQQGLTKTTFKRSFYIQLYLTAPVLLFQIPVLICDSVDSEIINYLAFIGIGVMLWFLISEALVIKKELDCGWLKAILLLALMYSSSIIIGFIYLMIVMMINMGNLQKMVDAVFGEALK